MAARAAMAATVAFPDLVVQARLRFRSISTVTAAPEGVEATAVAVARVQGGQAVAVAPVWGSAMQDLQSLRSPTSNSVADVQAKGGLAGAAGAQVQVHGPRTVLPAVVRMSAT